MNSLRQKITFGHYALATLIVAFEIAEEHGGCVAVKSEPGKGTAFHIRLPVTSDHADAPASAGRQA